VPPRRLSRNVLLSVIPWLVPTVVAVVAVPIAVRGLGDDGYGITALVGAVAGYLALTQVGFAKGIVRYISMFARRGDGRSMRECLRAVVAWFAIGGVIGGLAMLPLAPWLVTSVLKVPPNLTSQAIEAFRIGGLTFFLGAIASPLSYVPDAFLRYDLVAIIQTVLSSSSLAGPAILVLMGYGLIPVMWFGAALAGVTLLVYVVCGWWLVRSVPKQGPPFAEHRREFIGFVATEGANQVWCLVQNQTNKMLIGIAGGTSQVAYFQVSNTISGRTNELLNRMASVLLPTVSQLVADGDHERIVGLYERSSRLLFLLNASLTGAVIVFAAPLLGHWIDPRYATAGGTTLAVLVLAQLVAATSQAGGNVNLALGRPKVNLVFSVINSIVNLGTVYFLTVAYGIVGTALSILLAAFVMPVFVDYTNRKILRIPSWPVFRDCYLRTILVTTAVGVASWFLLRPLASNLFMTVVMLGVVTALSLALAAAVGVITPADRESMMALLRRRRPTPPSDGAGAGGGNSAG
jgi:O-antigen/teichoic acid export membrane protein